MVGLMAFASPVCARSGASSAWVGSIGRVSSRPDIRFRAAHANRSRPLVPRLPSIRMQGVRDLNVTDPEYGGVPMGAASAIEEIPMEKIPEHPEPLPDTWDRPGVFGIYSNENVLMYVSAVTNVGAAIAKIRAGIDDPAQVSAVRMMTFDTVDEAPLGKMAYNWVVSHTQEGDAGAPIGNTEEGEHWRIENTPEKTKGSTVYFRPGAKSDYDYVVVEIEEIIRENRVVLFMKGTRDAPQCGFSNQTVEILDEVLGDEFECVNCLDEERNGGLRDGIKKYSDWPTIPQLYIKGEFVGGADIVAAMYENGELVEELEKAEVPLKAAAA